MLDLRGNRIKYNNVDKKHFKYLRTKYGGNFTVKSWGDGEKATKKAKQKISLQLHTYQKYRCVYCERSLVGIDKEIDHIAPKHINPEYTFEAINLAYACGLCNGTSKKGQNPTIANNNGYYHQHIFLIVHPYLDNPAVHITYQDADKIYLDIPNCSPEGVNTIRMFDFDEDEMTIFRAKTLKNERDNPIDDETLKSLILKAVAYK